MNKLPPPSVYDLEYDTLRSSVGERTAARTYRRLYVDRRRPDASLAGIETATGTAGARPLTVLTTSPGRMSTKFLFGLPNGGAIEAVLIRRRTGMTACVSSQVGCAFGCTFCASGQRGLQRHLRAGEIVQQVLELGPRVNRIVFMGIGEPLHNYSQVLAAIRILRDRRGLAMRTSGITISTIGIPKRLRQLREEHLKINLTVSLHATTDEVRQRLIPGARSHAIAEVLGSSCSWAQRHNRPVTYVYLLLPEVNDTPEDAARLVEFLARTPARVNLMRWNPVLGGDRFRRIDDRGLTAFKKRLVSGGLNVTVRDTQGKDIDAACGQLRLREIA